MGKPTGFLEYTRELPKYKDPVERIGEYTEIYQPFPEAKTREQGARCMDCGVPFCHFGCPLGNIIPEFNDAVYKGDWALAYNILSSTNNFPEFTGRICPAPCEASCVLGINQPPVAIEHIEKNIIEKAFEFGLVKPEIPALRTGKKVAVVGSGPSGLAVAAQLNKAGHWVTVYERADKPGGLVRYGIPDFKMEKSVVERRVELMKEAGITFRMNSNIGENVPVSELKEYDAVALTGGSTMPRDLPIPGRDLKGIYPAMEFLSQQNKRVAGIDVQADHTGKAYQNGEIWATGKEVVVIGGGDTGSDCVGTSNRHHAKSVTQIELLAKPPEGRHESTPWPLWPMMLRTSSSHEEGCERKWAILTKNFVGNDKGEVVGIRTVEIEWKTEQGKPTFIEMQGTEKIQAADLVLLAMGFLHPQHTGLISDLGLELDERGNVKTENYKTSAEHIFAAGDMRRGQSLVVWAIAEGRECARAIDLHLMGESRLEARDRSMLHVEPEV